MWTHEETYKKFGFSNIIHKNRLKKILALFNTITIPEHGKFADFGCSSGYIIELLYKKYFRDSNWQLYGFDHSKELLELAKLRNIPNAEFFLIDLNHHNIEWQNNFDIVTCFETLEHVGYYKNAIINILESCKSGGITIISIPNEKRLPGLIKYFARKILRRNPYGDFFNNKSEVMYIWNLITNKPIEIFRSPDSDGWSPHLGFDWESVEKFMQENFFENKKFDLA